MEGLLSALRDEGWYLKNSAIETLEVSKRNHQEIISKALDLDICDIGEKYIQETIASSNDGILVGPCVLQVNKIRNISAPKDNEYSSVAPRMLKLSLTDGSNTVTAIEYEQLNGISLKTPPGTKVKLVGSIVLSQGCIQLTSSCIKVLGGKVEKLYTKWKIAQDMNAISRMSVQSDSGPPPFVAFGKRTSSTKRFDKATKSLQNNTKEDENENTDFTEQRKAAIAEVKHIANDKKETLSDARANFGKMPVGEPKAKPWPSSKHERNEYQPEPENTGSKKSVRMYRELPTESGQAVHQKTVNEFVSMGFKYEDVVLCLRKANNNFDEAMDLLTALPLPDTDSTNQYSQNRNARGRPNRSRGRGRNRDNSHMEQAATEQSSGPATLMDFIDNRMSNMLIPNKREQDVPREDIKSNRYDNGESRRDDYRGRGRGQNHGGYKRGGHNRQYNQLEGWHQKNNRSKSGAADDAQQNYSAGNPRHSQDKFHQQKSVGRTQETRPPHKNPSQTFGSSHRNDARVEKQISNDDNATKPRNNGSDYVNPRRHENKTSTRKEAHHMSLHHHSKPAGKNNVFRDVPLNPPPQRGPTTFGESSLNESHQINASSYNHPPQMFQVNMTQSLHVTIPQWQIGSHCLAKYWEDSQYYHAVITDVHPEAPTAVVNFVDFGNYEEVGLFDIKPIVTLNETPTQGISNQPYTDASRSYPDNRQQRRYTKPPMALYIHPKNRGNQ